MNERRGRKQKKKKGTGRKYILQKRKGTEVTQKTIKTELEKNIL